jgi:hypothetical protein
MQGDSPRVAAARPWLTYRPRLWGKARFSVESSFLLERQIPFSTFCLQMGKG